MSILRAAIGAPSKVANATGIAQDNIIFAMVLFAFVVWITTKGELPTYLGFFTPISGKQGPAVDTVTASSTTGGASQIPSSSVLSGPLGNVVNTVQTVGNAAGKATGIQSWFQGTDFGSSVTGWFKSLPSIGF